MNKRNNIKLVLGMAILCMLIFSACGGPRKCNGGRGTQTEMGTM